MKPLIVSFACNDYQTGQHQGWFDTVKVEDYQAVLDGPPTRIHDIGLGHMRIGRMKFTYTGCFEWYGNWCWDNYLIVEKKKLISLLLQRGFQCTEAPEIFYQWWQRKQESPT